MSKLTHDGGKPYVKDLPYKEPQGPTNQHRNAVGLGGHNYGNGQKKVAQGRESGSPGIGGKNHGNNGSQR